jgi:hypothetical protein
MQESGLSSYTTLTVRRGRVCTSMSLRHGSGSIEKSEGPKGVFQSGDVAHRSPNNVDPWVDLTVKNMSSDSKMNSPSTGPSYLWNARESALRAPPEDVLLSKERSRHMLSESLTRCSLLVCSTSNGSSRLRCEGGRCMHTTRSIRVLINGPRVAE